MYAQKEKTKENKSRAVANTIGQKKGNGKKGFGIFDQRPVSDGFRNITQLANVVQCVHEGLTRREDLEGLINNTAEVWDGGKPFLMGGSPAICIMTAKHAKFFKCNIGDILINDSVNSMTDMKKKVILWHECGHKITGHQTDTGEVFLYELAALEGFEREEQRNYLRAGRGKYT